VKSLRTHARPTKGAASLAVVMVLFFILAMVAAYTNRNLIFEQRTSANSYRSARALAAADAGVDWVIAMLNGGAINTQCAPASAPANNDFKTRYLTLQPDGSFAPVTWASPAFFPTGGLSHVQAQPACSATDAGGWNCSCPTDAPLKQQLDNTNVSGPVFAVSFDPMRQRPGVAAIRVRGCHNVRSGSVTDVNTFGSCHVNDLTATEPAVKAALEVDATAIVRVSLGLVGALPVAPTAAMTVLGDIKQDAGTLNAVNPDPATGVALRAGKTIGPSPAVKVAGAAGSTASPLGDDDADLKSIPTSDFFRLALGLPAEQYREQPAAVRCAAGCAALSTLVEKNPTRVIFVDGDLNLGTTAPMGSVTTPTMLVVNGDVTVSGKIDFKGVIFAAKNLNWDGSDGSVDGAIIVGGDYVGNGNANISYDREIVRRVHKSYGSFVRIPGSWNTEN
jgi:hypothetical protein